MELISLFFLTICSGLISSLNLSLIGAQLASRGQSVQSMVLAVGMSLGIILTMGLTHNLDEQHTFHLLPILGGIFFGISLLLLTQLIAKKIQGNKSSYFISIYAILLALTHLVTNIIPGLETHMAQNYFGDIAVMNDEENYINLFVSGFSLIVLLKFWKKISFVSFQTAIFGGSYWQLGSKKVNWIFWFFSILILIMSIHFLGFLFSLALLFIPSALLMKKDKSLRLFTGQLLLLSAISEITGFLVSLYFGNLPTTPVIILALLFWALVFNFLERIYYLRRH
jgi:ABC-type Mn2+/Zn2+ transport system permease subunit